MVPPSSAHAPIQSDFVVLALVWRAISPRARYTYRPSLALTSFDGSLAVASVAKGSRACAFAMKRKARRQLAWCTHKFALRTCVRTVRGPSQLFQGLALNPSF